MNPVHTITHVLEHTLVGHEQVAIFEASLTAAEDIKGEVNAEVCTLDQRAFNHWCQDRHLVYLGQLVKKSTRQAKRYVSEEENIQ